MKLEVVKSCVLKGSNEIRGCKELRPKGIQ